MGKKEEEAFSGSQKEWTWFKAKLLAYAAGKKLKLDRWMDVVDENINDDSKWKCVDPNDNSKWSTISDEKNKEMFNLLIRKLDKTNTTILSGKFKNDGMRAWEYLLRKYELRQKTDSGPNLLCAITSLHLEQFGTQKCEEYTGTLESALSVYERTTSKKWDDTDKIGFLLSGIPKTEEWSQTRVSIRNATTFGTA